MTKARQLADLGNAYDDGALSNRNLVINGAMQVAQRETSTAITSSSVYTLDRFETRLGGSYTVGATVTQESDGPDGFENCLKVDVTSTSTPATSNNFLIDYKPESQDMVHLNWGSSNGKYLTLSFWVKSNKTGLYGLGIIHDGKTRNWLSSYSISTADTWEYKTILIDPDTSSAFDNNNSSSLRINWHLSDGPDDLTATHSWEASGAYQSVTGAVNLCDSTSNYWQITGVQLEVGDTATPFEHRSYGDELAKCQRYYQKISTTSTSDRQMIGAGHYNTSIGIVIPYQHYGGIMRVSPTASISALNLFDIEPFDVAPVAVSFGDVTKLGCWINVTDTTARTKGFAASLFLDTSGAFVSFDAEL
jgi:hypothetical protein